jgi:hypothetical protein
VHFFKTLDFDGFCENSALRRDWCSSAHLLEGLEPYVSGPGWPKWPRKVGLRPRRTIQRTVVIGARPAPLLPQSKLFTSAACIFSTTHVFACVCSFRLAVVIRVRPALSFDQYGLLASTACTFLRRLMFTLFWNLLKPARLCGGRPLLGCLGCLLEAPGPPREARSPEALQGGGLGRLGLSLGSLGTSFGKFPGSRRHPKVAPGTGPL